MSQENETQTIPQMREQIKKLEADLKTRTAERDTALTDLKSRDAKDAFKGQDYNPSLGDLYILENPEGDLSAEAINEWANAKGFQPSTSEEASTEETDETDAAPGSSDLSILAGGGSGAGGGGAGGAGNNSLTIDEWKELQRTDPAAAKAATSRVAVSADNPFRTTPVAPTGNPYVPNVKT